jgi:WD40 repeat protein
VGTGKTVTLTGATLAGAQAANYTLTSVAADTADIMAAADGLTTWLDGEPTNAHTIYKYAIGGATNVNAASEEVRGSLDGERFSLTAVVRTNDPKLVVAGEASSDLRTWSTSSVADAVAPDQTGVFSGFQRRIFSVEATNNQPSLFLRLRALYSP